MNFSEQEKRISTMDYDVKFRKIDNLSEELKQNSNQTRKQMEENSITKKSHSENCPKS